jgi:hypothetical protein
MINPKRKTYKNFRTKSQDEKQVLLSQDNLEKTTKKLILNTSIFLLGRDNLKQVYWSISTCRYAFDLNILHIGVKTADGKAGTVLRNMRSNSAVLAEYLKAQKILPKTPKIIFFIDKNNEKEYVDKINSLIESVQFDLKLNLDNHS